MGPLLLPPEIPAWMRGIQLTPSVSREQEGFELGFLLKKTIKKRIFSGRKLCLSKGGRRDKQTPQNSDFGDAAQAKLTGHKERNKSKIQPNKSQMFITATCQHLN